MSYSTPIRISAHLIAGVLGHFFIIVPAQIFWKNYWIRQKENKGQPS